MLWASTVFGVLSAIAWLGAAIVPSAVVGSYWDHPPANITRRLKIGAVMNTAGALFGSHSAWSALPFDHPFDAVAALAVGLL